MQYYVIIPAAGEGKRFSKSLPKQYWQLKGRPVLSHVLEFFLGFSFVEKIMIALRQDDTYWDQIAFSQEPRVFSIIGGKERFLSVLQALSSLQNEINAEDWVLVHDACRPCLKKEDFLRLLNTLKEDSTGGILGVPLRDTLKRVDPQQNILETSDRQALWQAQTPQMFRYGILYDAMKTAAKQRLSITDEAMALEYMGYLPKIVLGSTSNIKITWPEDLLLAEAILGGT